MLAAIVDVFAVPSTVHAGIKAITDRFNTRRGDELGQPMTNKWVGGFVRRRLRLSTMKTGGLYVIPQSERTRISALAIRFGVEGME